MIRSPLLTENFSAEYRLDGNPDAGHLVLFAHGAGAGMDHPFMDQMAKLLAGDDICLIRFEFPYMVRAREEERRRPPDRLPKLEACFRQWIAAMPERKLTLMGKSMGGRVATVCGENADVEGVIALGYPFHPVGKREPDKWRWQPLQQASVPVLVLQGERDTFGSRAELAEHQLPAGVSLEYLADGDHSFQPRKASGLILADNLEQAAAHCRAFILG